jgi:hypothetical protein
MSDVQALRDFGEISSLPEVLAEVVWIIEELEQGLVHLGFLDSLVRNHARTAAEPLVRHFAVRFESIAVGCENKNVVPTYEVTGHGEMGAVGVNCALPVQHLCGDFFRVDYDQLIPERIHGAYVACYVA